MPAWGRVNSQTHYRSPFADGCTWLRMIAFKAFACLPFVTVVMAYIPSMTQGAFFNDMRDENAVDMSSTIRDFCQKHSIKVPPAAPSDPPGHPPSCSKPAQAEKSSKSQPRAHKMEETTFDDLFLRV